ncbi:MAG: glycoside hydrolase family 3 [Mucilaginibacter polytrichastri]|nr:glycoside hydrolase family 3 [Mucilaginibacter polytrichastri]
MRNFSLRIYIAALFLVSGDAVFAQQNSKSFIQSLEKQNFWVDSVLSKMSRHDKIAQLFMVRILSNKDSAYNDSVIAAVEKNRLGGVIFFQGGPVRQASLTNRLQRVSNIPLLVAIDGEWGLGMRLDSTISYPYQMTLGAIQDTRLIYQMGQEVAREFRRLGIHMNFAPDMDVNNNPRNPVINFRSFGENKYNVARKGVAYMKGMQDGGLLTTAKHFPGHGDTDVDSHADLPLLNFTRERLDSLELFPFRDAIMSGISGIMVAHMNIPALDTTKNLPSTLSQPIVTGLLKKQLGFTGLVVTDAMEMKGVTKNYPGGKADVLAILAGNDLLELSENTPRAIKMVRQAIRHDSLSWADIDAKVKKILTAKYWAGATTFKEVKTDGLLADLNRNSSRAFIQKLTDAAITQLKGQNLLPIRPDFISRTAIISVGPEKQTIFQQELRREYPDATIFNIPNAATAADIERLKTTLRSYGRFFLGLHDTRTRPYSELNYSSAVKMFIAEMSRKETYTAIFANPYTVAGLPGVEESKVLLIGYQPGDEMQRSAVKVLNGKMRATGRLPVTINTFFKFGDGIVLR